MMAIHSQFALAIDAIDEQKLASLFEKLTAANMAPDKTEKVETQDNTYLVYYWDHTAAYFEPMQALVEAVEDIRHAWIDVCEDGQIATSVVTSDDRGCDEEFYEILGWRADICIWGDQKISPEEDARSKDVWIVYGRYGCELERPRICSSQEEAEQLIEGIIAEDVRNDFMDDLLEEGIDLDDDVAVLAWGEENEYCTGNTYMYDSDWHEFSIEKEVVTLEEVSS